MDDRLEALARRFRRARSAHEAAAAAAREAEEARRREAQEARAALLEELAAFGQALDLDAVTRGEDGSITWRLGEASVGFAPRGLLDGVAVSWREGDEARSGGLDRVAEIGGRWVLSVDGPRGERVPLVETGLTRLAVRGLGLPDPEDVPPAEDAPTGRAL